MLESCNDNYEYARENCREAVMLNSCQSVKKRKRGIGKSNTYREKKSFKGFGIGSAIKSLFKSKEKNVKVMKETIP